MGLPVKYRGDTIKGRLQLRVKNSINPDLEDNFVLPATYVLEVKLPADPSGSVVLSTANAGEISIVSSTLSTIDYTCTPAKSALLLKTPALTLDVKVTDTTVTPNIITTFQKAKVFAVEDPANT